MKSEQEYGLKMESSFSNLFNASNGIPVPSLGGHNRHFGQQHHQYHYSHHPHHYGYNNPHNSQFNTSIDSCPESTPTCSKDSLHDSGISFGSSSPKTEYSSSPKNNNFQKNHNHHHHSIQELIRHWGKKVHNWKTDGNYNRRNSCLEDGNKLDEDFRGRSKSLDGTSRKRVVDCESTYRIYDTILKEGRCGRINHILFLC